MRNIVNETGLQIQSLIDYWMCQARSQDFAGGGEYQVKGLVNKAHWNNFGKWKEFWKVSSKFNSYSTNFKVNIAKFSKLFD